MAPLVSSLLTDFLLSRLYIFCRIVSDKPAITTPRLDRQITLKAIKCFYRGCKRPEVVEGPPVATGRPKDAKMWSDPATWENGLPGNDTDVTIKGIKEAVTNFISRSEGESHK